MRWYDRHKDEPFIGIWMRRKFGHKTTLVVTWIIQQILIDPCVTMGYFHAVDELAADLNHEVVNHILRNDALRALDPFGWQPPKVNKAGVTTNPGKRYKVWPAKVKKFYRTDRFTVNRHKFSRTPTLMSKGAGSEITGAHFTGPIWLDDIIARKTIENSELAKIERWVQSTIIPVSAGQLRCTGTPWSEQSIHQKWMQDPHWLTIVIPGAISESIDKVVEMLNGNERKIHFTPDYKYGNPMFWPEEFAGQARKQLKMESREMAGDFPPQIMCDSEPESEKPWSKACENFTALRKSDTSQGTEGPGAIFVLSDPAPFLEGGYKGLGEKSRQDGTKDYWSICVVKLRVRGSTMDIILLDGDRSQEWGDREGAQRAAHFMRKWNTPYFFSENPKIHHTHMLAACLQDGVTLRRARDGGPYKFADYNKADGKNSRIISLCDRARDCTFWICRDTCSEDFLTGDGVHTGFLTQVRKFRKVGPNKTNLRYDDDADVVARATDAALLEIAPKPQHIEASRPMSPFRDNSPQEEYTWGTRHVRV
jgi:hypothetical protein